MQLLRHLAVVVVALVVARTALAAASPRVRLEYARRDGAGACPDAEAIQSGVAARLGYEPFDAQAPGRIAAAVQRNGHALEAHVQVFDAAGQLVAERRLVSRRRDCVELAAAVELAISIAIDPFQAAARRPPEPPAPAAPPPVPPPPPAPPPAVERAPQPAVVVAPRPVPISVPISGQIEIGVLGAVGAAPAPSAGVTVRAAMRRRDLSLALEGRADLAAHRTIGSGTISSSLLVASASPCVHFARVLAACAALTVGALRAAGHDLLNARAVVVPYVAAGARLAGSLAVTAHVALVLHADVAAPLTETELRVADNEVWTSPPVAFAGGAGLAVDFP